MMDRKNTKNLIRSIGAYEVLSNNADPFVTGAICGIMAGILEPSKKEQKNTQNNKNSRRR